MPAKIRKTDGKYSVRTPSGVKAEGTTLRKAKAQQRLLNAIDHGFKPDRTKKKKKRRRPGSRPPTGRA